eukprot:2542099-Amphidinium_carterae.2
MKLSKVPAPTGPALEPLEVASGYMSASKADPMRLPSWTSMSATACSSSGSSLCVRCRPTWMSLHSLRVLQLFAGAPWRFLLVGVVAPLPKSLGEKIFMSELHLFAEQGRCSALFLVYAISSKTPADRVSEHQTQAQRVLWAMAAPLWAAFPSASIPRAFRAKHLEPALLLARTFAR